MSIAVQRFDCMLKVPVAVALNIRALIWFLCSLSTDSETWASDLLEFLVWKGQHASQRIIGSLGC